MRERDQQISQRVRVNNLDELLNADSPYYLCYQELDGRTRYGFPKREDDLINMLSLSLNQWEEIEAELLTGIDHFIEEGSLYKIEVDLDRSIDDFLGQRGDFYRMIRNVELTNASFRDNVKRGIESCIYRILFSDNVAREVNKVNKELDVFFLIDDYAGGVIIGADIGVSVVEALASDRYSGQNLENLFSNGDLYFLHNIRSRNRRTVKNQAFLEDDLPEVEATQIPIPIDRESVREKLIYFNVGIVMGAMCVFLLSEASEDFSNWKQISVLTAGALLASTFSAYTVDLLNAQQMSEDINLPTEATFVSEEVYGRDGVPFTR